MGETGVPEEEVARTRFTIWTRDVCLYSVTPYSTRAEISMASPESRSCRGVGRASAAPRGIHGRQHDGLANGRRSERDKSVGAVLHPAQRGIFQGNREDEGDFQGSAATGCLTNVGSHAGQFDAITVMESVLGVAKEGVQHPGVVAVTGPDDERVDVGSRNANGLKMARAEQAQTPRERHLLASPDQHAGTRDKHQRGIDDDQVLGRDGLIEGADQHLFRQRFRYHRAGGAEHQGRWGDDGVDQDKERRDRDGPDAPGPSAQTVSGRAKGCGQELRDQSHRAEAGEYEQPVGGEGGADRQDGKQRAQRPEACDAVVAQ
jgi:hypothetical protein